MTAYLFSPPYRRQIDVLHGYGGLKCGYPVCWIVFKVDGVWQAQESPAAEILNAAEWPLPESPCTRPQVVPNAMGVELLAALDALNASLPTGIQPATCIPIQA